LGQLGYGTTANLGQTPESVPSQIGDINLGGKAIAISAGGFHTCVLLEGGRIRCWGDNHSGQLGYGHTRTLGCIPESVPSKIGDVDLGSKALAISTGNGHTCALLEGGRLRCWGDNQSGELGYGHRNNLGQKAETIPAKIGDVDLGGQAKAISAGGHHTCALLDEGQIRCWGDNTFGQLGYGHKNNLGATLPSKLGDVALGGKASAIAAGDSHTCALLAKGRVRCWGLNDDGQAGAGYTSELAAAPASLTPGFVQMFQGEKDIITAISAGGTHTCAMLRPGRVRCWGRNDSGHLGYGHTLTLADMPFQWVPIVEGAFPFLVPAADDR
jgi:alpha-tubulin suppressor-like RCC1 family protein